MFRNDGPNRVESGLLNERFGQSLQAKAL